MAIQYVGGNTATKAGATSGNSTISLTTLTGGISSTAAIGDIVIAVFATGAAADRTLVIQDPSAVAYTLIGTELYSNGTTYDSNLRVAYKVLTAADATTVFGPTGNAQDAGSMAVHVWRGVDPTTPLDVAATTATGTGTGRPNPPAIAPTTAGSEIIVAGGAAAGTGAVFVGTGLANFRTATSVDTNDAMVGIGSFDWVSGTYDPAAWTGGTANAADSWTALTLALRRFVPALNAEPGSFTYTGQAAFLDADRNTNAEAGSFSYLGQDAELIVTAAPKEINAEEGTFSYLGQEATLSAGRAVNAEDGTFSYLGQDANLTATRSVNAESGTFSYLGQDAGLTATRSLSAEAGTFSYLGQDATLIYTQAQGIDAQPGSFSYLGQDASLTATRSLNAEAGSFSYIGQNATLQATKSVNAEAGSFSYLGQDASLQAARAVSADAGTFNYIGQDATLTTGRSLNAEAGTFSYTGQDATLLTSVSLNAQPGSFEYLGQDATLEIKGAFNAEAGSFAIAGQSATLLRTYKFTAEAAAFGEADPYVDPGYVDPYYSTNLTASLGYGRMFNAQAGAFAYLGQDATFVMGFLYPPEADVKAGIVYGPGGIYTGSYAPAGRAIFIFDD